ncbi:terminase gpA endonuclease subunit [Rhizobium johnstonii]|uniref:terminase gpA endonuclease subunit n=1 Tax=Rhizobium johnstonii TaxID=3019933 RepID=UPI003F9CAD30
MSALEQRFDGIKLGEVDYAKSYAEFEEQLLGLLDTALQIPPHLDPAAWAYENIELPAAKTFRPGFMKFTGYQRALTDAIFEDGVDEIVVLKGARVGYSSWAAAVVMYMLAYKAVPVGIVQPTADMALDYYKASIEPLFRAIPAVAAIRRKPGRGEIQDEMLDHVFSNEATLKIVGAAAEDGLRGWRAWFTIIDEFSSKTYKASSKSQGDKALIIKERGNEWSTSVAVFGSTPTYVEDCLTYMRWVGSDQSLPYLKCPHCDLWQNFKWGDRDSRFGFKWNRDEHGHITDCWYQCEGEKNCRIDEKFKHQMVENVEYRPSKVPKYKGRRGFHIPQWLSSAGKSAWKFLAQRFVDAKGDPQAMKTWKNLVAGWPFDDFTTSTLDAGAVSRLIIPYPADVPDDVVVLTAGVDTQTNKEGAASGEQIASREVSVIGWTRFGQFRVIGHWIITGAPGDPSADSALTDLFNRGFEKRDGKKFYIQAAAIDLGGHFADDTRAYTSKFPATRNIWAIKGRNNAKGSRSPTVWPKKASRSSKSGVIFYTIDSQLARDSIFRLLQLTGDNAPMVPQSMPADYLEKLMCEERKKVQLGYYWQPKHGGRAEEEWMCLAYAYVALKGLQASYQRWRDLNVAADRLEIPKVGHDPTTGEIDYDGPDRSAHSQEAASRIMPLDTVSIGREQLALTAPKPRTNAVAAEPVAVPKAEDRPRVRKRRSGGVRAWA